MQVVSLKKAVILVGGYGTRLRPLTLSHAKPLIPVCNTPIVVRQVEELIEAGVTHIILVGGSQVKEMEESLLDMKHMFNIKITSVVEIIPLDTAGAIHNIRYLLGDEDEPFIVINGDVVFSFPIQQLIQFHSSHNGKASMFTTRVADSSKYGVVESQGGLVVSFSEKPSMRKDIGNEINSGIYICHLSVFDAVTTFPCSLERQVFPLLVEEKSLYSMTFDGFWIDIGCHSDYLEANRLLLQHFNTTHMIDSTARVHSKCKIGKNVVIGPGCIVEQGCSLEDCVLLSDVIVGRSTFIKNSTIGWKSCIGHHNHLENVVFGEDVSTSFGIVIIGTCVLPHKSVSNHQLVTGSVVM